MQTALGRVIRDNERLPEMVRMAVCTGWQLPSV